jgi:phosphoribosylformylglycinamidine synthase
VRVEIYAPGGALDGDVVLVPPGLAAAPPAETLRAYARAGGTLLGLGDGVGWLCGAGLLPGAVDAGVGPPATHVRVEGRATAITWAIPAGRILALGRPSPSGYVAADVDVAALGARGQIVLRYCDASGGVARGVARSATVAGLSDESGRVIGLLSPASPDLDDEVGRQLLTCIRTPRGEGTARKKIADFK